MIDTVACPTCRRPLRVPNTLLGQLVKCPACEQTFTASEDLEPARRPGTDRSPEVEELEPVDEHPPKRSERRGRDWEDDRDEDGRDRLDIRRRSRKKVEPPGKATAVAIMTLVGGIFAVLWSVVKLPFCFFLLWPGTYYGLIAGIFCIIKGAQLLSPTGRYEGPPTVTAILQIINLINLDLVNLTLGILNLVFIHDDELRRYYRR
jgi:hypothetical protein